MKFDFYYSLPFWAAFIVVALVSALLAKKAKGKGISLFIFSCVFLLALPRFSPLFLLTLLGLVLMSYMAGYSLNREGFLKDKRVRRLVLFLGLLIVVLFLFVFKYPSIQRWFSLGRGSVGQPSSGFVFFIGVSYFTFRMIHFLVEASKKKIVALDMLTYANYILFFPAFISGPINRYNHFSSQFEDHPPLAIGSSWKAGAERIINGLFKKFVLVQILYPKILELQSPEMSFTGGSFLVGLYAYAFYFYFDFSAYTDLAIGCAKILGIDLPENFNKPLLRKNIRELWTNWHMSLTSWLVDYIYWPIVRIGRNVAYFRYRPIMLSNLGMVITFVICGAWHGETPNFIIWGAYHGLGISVMTIYQREKRKVRNGLAQRYFRSKFSQLLGVFFTFNYFVVGLVFFLFDFEKLKLLISKL